MQLSDKYEFLTKYFNEAKNTDNYSVFQALLFYGSDLESQYKMALYVAKMLNCERNFDENCNCQNCRWIDSHEHPAVITVSKVDYKPEDDTSKTVISLKQAQMIKNSLTNSSDYHRVFIFCDKGNNDEILGLNQMNFQEETANALLKTIEEPPKNTTFIFLTRDKNDVLQTIQSRCMAFFVPSFEIEGYDYSLVEDVFADYFEFERNTTLLNLRMELDTVKASCLQKKRFDLLGLRQRQRHFLTFPSQVLLLLLHHHFIIHSIILL